MQSYQIAVSEICLAFILAGILFLYRTKIESNIITKSLLYTCIVRLVSDAASWAFDGFSGIFWAAVVYASNYVSFVASECTALVFVIFIFKLVQKKGEKTDITLMLLCITTTISILFLNANIFGGWIYYIDELNSYHRGKFYLFSIINTIFSLITVMILLQKYKDRYTQKQKLLARFYYIIMVAATIGQLRYFGLTFMSYAQTFSAIVAFLISELEDQNELLKAHEMNLKHVEEISALNKELNQNLKVTNSYGDMYDFAYYIDFEKNEFTTLKSKHNKYVCASLDKLKNAFDILVDEKIVEENKEKMRHFTDLNTIQQRLMVSNGLFCDYEITKNIWFRANWIVSDKNQQGEVKSAIYAVRNIDDLVRGEKQQSSIIRSLSYTYNSLYTINVLDDTFKEITSDIRGVREIIGPEGKASAQFEVMSRVLIKDPYKKQVREFVDLKTIQQRLKDKNYISIQFEGARFGWAEASFIVVNRNSDGEITQLLWCVRDINEQKSVELRQQELLKSAAENAEKQVRKITNLNERLFDNQTRLKQSITQQENQIQEILNLNNVMSDYNNIIGNAGFGIWHIILKDGQKPKMQANDKMLEIMGCKDNNLTEEEVYDFWYDRILPDALPSVMDSLQEMLSGKVSENTYQWNHPAKGIVYTRCGGSATILEDGTQLFSGYHGDVTGIELHQQKQRESLKQLNSELEAQLDIIGGLSNAFFCCYGGNLDTNQFLAVKVIDSMHDAVKNCSTISDAFSIYIPNCVDVSDHQKMIEFTDVSTLKERLRNRDVITQEYNSIFGIWKHCRAHWIVAKRHENGEPYGVLYALEDITQEYRDRKNKEAELQEAKTRAEAANHAKTMFLNNMSHDIRTPMNAILGFSKLMENKKNDPEAVSDYLKKIEDSGEYLLSIINNVLDMARIESGKIEFNEEVVDVLNIEEGLPDLFSNEIEKKNLKLDCQADIQNQYVLADKARMKQILINLLSNAVKYTPDGGSVKIEIHEAQSGRNGYAHHIIKVSDTGIGMAEEFQQHVFDAFEREKTTTESKVIGTGLGMSIVKKLVDLMGGTIKVKSQLGVGTTFTLDMYFRIAESSAKYLAENMSMQIDNDRLVGKRILLAEDNDLNAEIAMTILQEYGLIIERASDGIECVSMLSAAESHYYDAIMMDIQMPNMNGYQATEMIRAFRDKDIAQIPIIAMTANAFEEDKQLAIKAGMNGHLAKPIDTSKLLEMLTKLI